MVKQLYWVWMGVLEVKTVKLRDRNRIGLHLSKRQSGNILSLKIHFFSWSSRRHLIPHSAGRRQEKEQIFSVTSGE
jgi:hypothetical protein